MLTYCPRWTWLSVSLSRANIGPLNPPVGICTKPTACKIYKNYWNRIIRRQYHDLASFETIGNCTWYCHTNIRILIRIKHCRAIVLIKHMQTSSTNHINIIIFQYHCTIGLIAVNVTCF